MRRRRYGLYLPSRRSRASTHVRVLRRRYERSWIVSGAFTSVFWSQRRGSIQDEAENADERALREAKRALVEKALGAYLAKVPEGENPCDKCPVEFAVEFFEDFSCTDCPDEYRANPSQMSAVCQNDQEKTARLSVRGS